MLSERYKQRVPFGLLHYTRTPAAPAAAGAPSRNKKDDETLAIRPGSGPGVPDAAPQRARGRVNQPRGRVRSPAVDVTGAETDGSAASGRFSRAPLGARRAAADGAVPQRVRAVLLRGVPHRERRARGGRGEAADPAIAALARKPWGTSRPRSRELRRWLGLVDMEAAASAARRATPWMPVEDVRRRGAFAVAGLRLAPSKTFAKSVPRKGPTSLRVQQPAVRPLRGRGRPPGRAKRATAAERARRRRARLCTSCTYLRRLSSPGELRRRKASLGAGYGRGRGRGVVLATLRAGDRLVLSREPAASSSGARSSWTWRRRRPRTARARRRLRRRGARRVGARVRFEAPARRPTPTRGGWTATTAAARCPAARAPRSWTRSRQRSARGGAAPPPVRPRAARV